VLDWARVDSGSGSGMSDGLEQGISNPPFCMLLFLAKFLSTNVTIGSGASGGIFSPSLFVGATLGGVWGHICSALLGSKYYDPIQACVAGMAGMVGGSTGASVTAITMTFEMTRDYSTILPIIITTVLAHMTRKAISEDSIYTLKLVRRGHVVPEGLQAAVHAAQRVQDVMTTNFRWVGQKEPMTQYDGITLVLDEASSHVNEVDARTRTWSGGGGGELGRVCGPVTIDYQSLMGHDLAAANYIAYLATGKDGSNFVRVTPKDDLNAALVQMMKIHAQCLLVVQDQDTQLTADVVGVVTPSDVTDNYSRKAGLLSRDRTLSTPRKTNIQEKIAQKKVVAALTGQGQAVVASEEKLHVKLMKQRARKVTAPKSSPKGGLEDALLGQIGRGPKGR
jgi:hypothetical protein